jgi:hypothetical protein
MFIIFGWRTIIKNIGAVYKKMCDRCHNEKFWILTKSTRWFTLFFIPIIPTRTRYFLACPICKHGYVLTGEQLKVAKPLAEINQQLANGSITEAEHTARMNLLNGQQSNYVEAKTPNSAALPQSEKKLGYCADCGKQIDRSLNFCGNCGTAVISK